MTTEEIDLDAIASIQDVEAILDKLLLEEAEVDTKLEHLLNPNNQPDLTSLTTLQSINNHTRPIIPIKRTDWSCSRNSKWSK